MQYLVHIGYPKSASTWLQKRIFASGAYGFSPLANQVESYKPGFDVFDSNSAQAEIEARTDAAAAITVLSSEAWVGMHKPGMTDRYAEHIANTLPNGKVLIVVRSQPELLVSAYLHWVVNYRYSNGLRRFLTEFSPRADYSQVVGLYDRLLGADRVLVVPFEPIKRSATEFVAPIFGAFGLPPPTDLDSAAENRRDIHQAAVLAAVPWMGRARFSLGAKLAMKVGRSLGDRWASRQRQALKERIVDEVSDAFRDGNRYLSSRIGSDLGAMGYPI